MKLPGARASCTFFKPPARSPVPRRILRLQSPQQRRAGRGTGLPGYRNCATGSGMRDDRLLSATGQGRAPSECPSASLLTALRPDPRLRMLDRTRRDLALGARSLLRAPTLSVTVVLILGLAIGLSSAMFSVFQSVLLHRL